MLLGVAFGGAGSLLSGANIAKMGLMAASAAGMYLLNGKKEKGQVARLDDLKVSSSAYGRGIAICFGTMRVTGNMFWATDFEETLKHISSKGKGGKKAEKKGTPYYEYHANFAMALCEGPVEEVLRIWADSNLIYDKLNPDNDEIVSVGFSQEQSGGGKSGFGMGKKKGGQGGDSSRFQFRFYKGTESQRQDPFMVEKQGAAKVPAHRGLCYLFFEHFALADFGNRIPTITAEVATKKQQTAAYNILENLDPYVLKGQGSGASNFVDPERYRIYSVSQTSTTGASTGYIQIYDISQDSEIRNVNFSEINTINANVAPVHKTLAFGVDGGTFPWAVGNILGIAGNGDIVVRASTGVQAYPISFLDPNSFVEKHRFGTASVEFSNGQTRITFPKNCSPTSYLEVSASLTGEVETTPKRATIVQSWLGWFYVFGQDHEPLAYFQAFSPYFASAVVPLSYGPPGINGGTFYGVSEKDLYEVTWTIGTGDGGITSPDLTSSSSSAVVRLREGSGDISYHAVQYLFGAERLVWFESIEDGGSNDGIWAVKYNLKTRTTEWRERVTTNADAGPGTSRMTAPINSSNLVCWVYSNIVYIVDFVTEDTRYYTVGASEKYTLLGQEQIYWAARGAVLTTILDPADNERKWALVLIDRNNQVPADAQYILTSISTRVGIPNDKLDFVNFNSSTIKGYLIENPTNARVIVEDLAQVFMFDAVESDYMLKFVSRGQESVVTVPQQDLAVVDNDTGDYFVEAIQQAIDLPQTVVVSYINPDKDYQTGARHYRRPRSPMPVMQSREKLDINLPMALTGSEAKKLAHKVAMTLWSERNLYEVRLPWSYIKYDPTDVMRFQMDNGFVFETRMMRMDLGADFTIEADGVAQTPSSYVSTAEAEEPGGVVRLPISFIPNVRAYAANIPYLEDTDDVGSGSFAYYWGVGAYGAGYRGAVVEYKLSGIDWTLVDVATEEVVWGQVLGDVPPPPHGPFATDDTSVITLIPAYPYDTPQGLTYAWESIPDASWPSTANTIIIGDEIIYFKNAAIQGDGNVQISTLIRGARGTENAAYAHGSNELFVINSTGLLQKTAPFLYMNKEWMFKSYYSISSLTPFIHTDTLEAATHKPWALVKFKRSGATNITITFERRTRLGGDMKDGTGTIPLNEESELYDVYLLSAPFDPDTFDPDNDATYVRAYTGLTAKTFTYTTAQQSTDGFVSSNNLYVVGFQISAVAGRGFPGYATLYPTVLT